MNQEQVKQDYLLALYGAHSITKTVIGFYESINSEDNDELELLEHITNICEREGLSTDCLILLKEIFHLLIQYRNNKGRNITEDELKSTELICENYVQTVFNTFPCFKKEDDGRYFFFPKA